MKKHTILVVDDNKTNLMAIRSVLEEDYNLLMAASGMQALKFLERKIPDLILLDIMMPEMDGRETFRRIKQIESCADIPIIFLTADTSSETEVDCLRIGASDFITKPIVPEVVKSRIAHTIDLNELKNDLEGRLEEAKESLRLVLKEKERIEAELNVARQIQKDALPPVTPPPFPERSEFDLYALMKPAKEVAGDFYDFFMKDEDHLCLVIADVSGKGVPAALFMMTCKTMIKDHTNFHASPAQILEMVNDLLCENNDSEMFVSVWLGILELSTGILTSVNAGHEYPIIKRSGQKAELLKEKHSLVLAALKGKKYKDETIILKPGDILYLYTDGIPEATNQNKNLFGTDRMLEVLDKEEPLEFKDSTRNIEEAIDIFVSEEPQFDDITMLNVRYNGPK